MIDAAAARELFEDAELVLNGPAADVLRLRERVLVRRIFDLAATVEALSAENGALRTERDRLARILAVERGDESAAPEGWRRDLHCTGVAYVRPHLGTQFRAAYSGEAECAWYGWTAAHPGEDVFSDGHASLLAAMEAADAATKGAP